MPRKVEISHKTILFTIFLLLGLWVLYQIRAVLLALFVAIILMSSLNTTVDRLERLRVPRWLAILFLYLLIFGGFSLVLAALVPPLVEQTGEFINQSVFYLQSLSSLGINPNVITSQISQLGVLSTNILRLAAEIFSNFLTILFLMMITFYLLMERKKLNYYLTLLFGNNDGRVVSVVEKIEKQLGGWVRGEAILMTIIGVITYIGLRFLGVEFALPLAILAGILEIVPNIGPIIAAIPAVLLGSTISPLMGLAVAALYFLIQQLENNLIVPKVMEKAVGMSPLVVILALAVGLKLAGVGGSILAVPIFLVLRVVVLEFFASKIPKNL